MPNNGTYGLNMLMEAMKSSEAAEAALETEMSLMNNAADDEVKRLIIGEDSVENDMAGHGMSEEKKKKLEDFINNIPKTKSDNLDDTETMETMLIALENCTQELNEEED